MSRSSADDLEITIAELGKANGLPLETGKDDEATLLTSPAEESTTPAENRFGQARC